MLKMNLAAGLSPSPTPTSNASPVSSPCSSTMLTVTSTPAALSTSGLIGSSIPLLILIIAFARATIRDTSALMVIDSLNASNLTSPCTGAAIATGMIVSTIRSPPITASADWEQIPMASRDVICTVPLSRTCPLNTTESLPTPAK